MNEEFNLSEKRGRSELLRDTLGIDEEWWYPENNVKEFIKRLKELTNLEQKNGIYPMDKKFVHLAIDNLAGAELSGVVAGRSDESIASK